MALGCTMPEPSAPLLADHMNQTTVCCCAFCIFNNGMRVLERKGRLARAVGSYTRAPKTDLTSRVDALAAVVDPLDNAVSTSLTREHSTATVVRALSSLLDTISLPSLHLPVASSVFGLPRQATLITAGERQAAPAVILLPAQCPRSLAALLSRQAPSDPDDEPSIAWQVGNHDTRVNFRNAPPCDRASSSNITPPWSMCCILDS